MTQLFQNPPPVFQPSAARREARGFQPLENQTLAFSKDWKISRKIFKGLESLCTIIILLALIITGCVPSESQKKQIATRYTTLMRGWLGETGGISSNYTVQVEAIWDYRKPPDDRNKAQITALFVRARREQVEVHRKYAVLLSKETPREFFNLPFAESQQMLLAMSVADSKWAQLQEAGDRKRANEVYYENMQVVDECKKKLAEWAQVFNTHDDPVFLSARNTVLIISKTSTHRIRK